MNSIDIIERQAGVWLTNLIKQSSEWEIMVEFEKFNGCLMYSIYGFSSQIFLEAHEQLFSVNQMGVVLVTTGTAWTTQTVIELNWTVICNGTLIELKVFC